MAITAEQTALTEALHIDVGYKFYTALAADVTATDIDQDETFSPDGSWTEITSIVTGGVHFSNTLNESGAIIDWNATVSGVSYNSTSLDRGRLMLARRRLWPTDAAAWTSWTVWWCGYIDRVTPATDDHDQMGRWTANIRSLSFLMERADAPAHNFGRMNIATAGTATASSVLTNVIAEGGKGEFQGIPSVEAANTIDSNMDTLWISNLAPSPTADTVDVTNSPNICVNEIYREPTGYDKGYRWIELYKAKGSDGEKLKNWAICSKAGSLNFSGLGDNYSLNVGDYLILCANRECFEAMFDAGGATVIDWRHIPAGGENGIAGSLWTYDSVNDYLYTEVAGDATNSCCAWGEGPDPGEVWEGDLEPRPEVGQSLKRIEVAYHHHGTHSGPEDWATEEYPSPGAHDTLASDSWEWLSVDLGTYAWSFASAVSAEDTTITVTPNTDGLTTGPTKTIITDDDNDIIYYTGKTSTTLTGVTGIAVGGHAQGITFGQYEGGLRTVLPKLGGVDWKRRRGSATTNKPVPKNFAIFYSTGASPNYPGTEDWELDWVNASGFFQSYNSWAWTGWVFPNRPAGDLLRPRGRHVMLVIKKMGDSGRAKINELKIYADETTMDADAYLEDLDTSTIIEHLLVDHYGLDADQIDITDGVRMGPFSTQKSDYVSVISEICKRSGTILQFRRDLKVYTVQDTQFVSGAWSAQYDIDKQSACRITPSFGYPDNIGQVQLTARTYDNATKEDHVFEVSYPQSANTGEVRKIYGEAIVGSEAEAYLFAEAHYKRARVAKRVDVAMSAISDPWCRPLTNVTLTWDMDAAGTVVDFDTDLFLVAGIDVLVDLGHPKGYNETVSLVEYIP
jgi:hypothetical protein